MTTITFPPVCRLPLPWNGKTDHWGFAFYSYSNDQYELSIYDDGKFTGKPERAFMISANIYSNK